MEQLQAQNYWHLAFANGKVLTAFELLEAITYIINLEGTLLGFLKSDFDDFNVGFLHVLLLYNLHSIRYEVHASLAPASASVLT